MTSEVYRSIPDTIKGLQENNYTLYATVINEDQIKRQKDIWEDM